MWRKENITLKLKILTAHFTGVQKIITLSLVILMLSFVNITLNSFVSNSSVSALSYTTSQRLDFTFDPTVKVTLSSSDLTISNLTLGNSSDSNIIDITAETNVATGLSLSAMVGGENNKLERVGDTSQDKDSFTALDSNVATLAGFGTNTWGYSYCLSACSTANNWVSGNSGSTNVGYNGLTTSPGVTIASTSSPSSNTVQFKIGAKADMVQASGTYTNTIDFVAVSNVVTTSYTVTFNNGIGASNWPDTVTGTTTSEANVKLWAGQTFTKAPGKVDYTFMGWCTSNTSDDTCSGNVYQANETYPISSLSSADGPVNIALYAMWKRAVCNPDGITIATNNSETDIVCMQDVSSSNKSAILTAMNAGTQYHLLDARDYQDYTVAKLADGKIWMTKNLNLPGGTALSVDNTDVESSYISSFSTSNNLTETDDTIVLPASSASGFSRDNYSFVYNSQSETCGNNSPCYSYYSWDAATLGSGRSIGTDNTDAPYSICPKGWKLPSTYNGSGTAAEDTDFRALIIALGGSNSIQTYNSGTSPTGATMYDAIKAGTAPNFLLAGYYRNGSFDNGGSHGYYWSSTSFSSGSYARDLSFYSSTVGSASYGNRRYGVSVRCLVK